MFFRHYILLGLMFLFVLASPAFANWVSLDRNAQEGSAPEIKVIVSSKDSITLEVNLPGFFREMEQRLWKIQIPGSATTEKIGKSALPVVSGLIAIPAHVKNAEISNLQILNSQEFDNSSVYPFQKPTTEDFTAKFHQDKEHYRSNALFPVQLLATEKVAIWRNQKILPFRFVPMQVTPAASKLLVHTKVRFTLKYQKGANNLIRVAPSHVFETMFRETLINYTPRNIARNNGKYLVIATDGLHQAAQALVGWKKGKGGEVDSVKLSTVGKTAQNIKDYISKEYTRGISYVLLVGDPADLPLYRWSRNPGDYWYSCTAGNDLYADLAVGRICAKTPGEVDNYVRKIQAYEKSNGEWATKSLLVSHRENAPGKYHGCIEQVRKTSYDYQVSFTVRHGKNSSNTNATLQNDINKGFAIVTYRGHGSNSAWTGWNGSYFTNRHVYELKNDVYPVVFSICCSNSQLDSGSETFAEANLNHPGGASAFLGATRPSYTIPNHDFCKSLFLGAFQKGLNTVGDVSNYANAQLIKKYGSSSYAMNNVKMYLWLGDPGMKLHVRK